MLTPVSFPVQNIMDASELRAYFKAQGLSDVMVEELVERLHKSKFNLTLKVESTTGKIYSIGF